MKTLLSIAFCLVSFSTLAQTTELEDILGYIHTNVLEESEQEEAQFRASLMPLETDTALKSHIFKNDVARLPQVFGEIEQMKFVGHDSVGHEKLKTKVQSWLSTYGEQAFFCQNLTVDTSEFPMDTLCEDFVDRLLNLIVDSGLEFHAMYVQGRDYGRNGALFMYLRDANDDTYARIYLDLIHEI